MVFGRNHFNPNVGITLFGMVATYYSKHKFSKKTVRNSIQMVTQTPDLVLKENLFFGIVKCLFMYRLGTSAELLLRVRVEEGKQR
jgi:hypothetical protein